MCCTSSRMRFGDFASVVAYDSLARTILHITTSRTAVGTCIRLRADPLGDDGPARHPQPAPLLSCQWLRVGKPCMPCHSSSGHQRPSASTSARDGFCRTDWQGARGTHAQLGRLARRVHRETCAMGDRTSSSCTSTRSAMNGIPTPRSDFFPCI